MEKQQAGDRQPNSAVTNPVQPSLSPYVVDSGAGLEANVGNSAGARSHAPNSELSDLDDVEAVAIVPVEPTALTPPQRRSTTAAKRRSPATFRRLWEVKLSQEMQQLSYQAQVQQINQGLADRARVRVQSGQVASSGEQIYSSYALPEQFVQKPRQRAFAPIEEAVKMTHSEPHSDNSRHAEINQINQLLTQPERDRAEPQTGAKTVPPQTASQSPSQIQLSSPNPFNSAAFTAGIEAFSTQPPGSPLPPPAPTTAVNWQQAEQEAGQTAAALRYLSSRDSAPRGTHSAPMPLRELLPNRSRATEKRWLRLPHGMVDKLGDAVLWVVATAAVRVATNLLLVAMPALTPVVTLLMFAPATLAIALAFFVPNASFLPIYRLFLISIGLLLGGKL